MKCIVHSCPNRTHEGSFTGNVCSPCFQYATAVRDNMEHNHKWHFVKGVMPDIREQLEEIFKRGVREAR